MWVATSPRRGKATCPCPRVQILGGRKGFPALPLAKACRTPSSDYLRKEIPEKEAGEAQPFVLLAPTVPVRCAVCGVRVRVRVQVQVSSRKGGREKCLWDVCAVILCRTASHLRRRHSYRAVHSKRHVCPHHVHGKDGCSVHQHQDNCLWPPWSCRRRPRYCDHPLPAESRSKPTRASVKLTHCQVFFEKSGEYSRQYASACFDTHGCGLCHCRLYHSWGHSGDSNVLNPSSCRAERPGGVREQDHVSITQIWRQTPRILLCWGMPAERTELGTQH